MDIKEIINKYVNEYGIITNIELLINDLKLNYSEQERIYILKEILIYNEKKYKEMNIQLIELDKSIKKPIVQIIPETISNNISNEIVTGLNIDVSKYITQIENANNEIDLITILNNINSDNIIEIIKCKLLELITLYKKELLISNEDSSYYIEQINDLNAKLDFIINYQKIIEPNINEIENNKLIFLMDNFDSPVIDDIEKLDQSEYSSYYSMLTSIIIGTFVRQRSFFISKGFKIFEIRNINGNRVV